MAQTDKDGRYQLLYSASYSGAPIGRNDVSISGDDGTQPRIPGRYALPGTFECDVQPGTNVFDLALTKVPAP